MKKLAAEYSRFYFLGIGGIGMSAVASYFLGQGKQVAGYDRVASSLTDKLQASGAIITFDDDVLSIPSDFRGDPSGTLIIYTPAVPATNLQLSYFNQAGFTVVKRSWILGQIMSQVPYAAIAGTHGKTSTASLLTHLLADSGIGTLALTGGIMENYDSNFYQSSGIPLEAGITEADEYDRSFLTLNPTVALITNIDPDHLDVYGEPEEVVSAYKAFSKQVAPGGKLILHESIAARFGDKSMTYGREATSDYRYCNLRVEDGWMVFDADLGGKRLKELKIITPGEHNVCNAIGALAAASYWVKDEWSIRLALQSYRGVSRRFQIKYNGAGGVVIDDYAHHPAELKACIHAIRQFFGPRHLTVVFQPHLYTRTRDFAAEFSTSLSMAEQVFVLPIYPARELPIEGVSSHMLLQHPLAGKARVVEKDQIEEILSEGRTDIILVAGAGDIDKLVDKIAKLASQKIKKEALA